MSNLPVSALIRQGGPLGTEDGMDSGKRKSKDEYRKQKDLEEQRKAGTAPAMVDVETGRDINPHIPEFIEKTPWYIPHSGPTLKHQRPQADRQKEFSTLAEWYPKGTTDRVAFKYRDGACENCGAMGHRKKDCFEKPRLVGAKWTSSNIAPDDHQLPKLEMGFDAKRDRWNGYNAEDYQFVMQEYNKMDETRRLMRAEQLKEAGEDEAKLEEELDEDIYAEDASAPGQSVDMDSRTRITVRNLRIREDTAKYLYSLNPDGPYYDPKSRSMRENPYKNVPGKEQEAAQFAGENFVRFTGEVAEATEAQLFAWQARCKGIDVHSLAEPTRLEALKKEFEKQKEESKSSVRNELLEKYGGEEHMSAPPKELLLAQTENYVEYNRKGKVVKGDERPAAKSRYEEDVLINNHTSVWGSYWRDTRWGYACCHQFLRNTYCIGEQGILAEIAELGPVIGARGGGQQIGKAQTEALNNSAKKAEAPSDEMQTAMKEMIGKKDEEEEEIKEMKPMERKKKSKKSGENSDSSEGSGSEKEEGDTKTDEEEEEEMDEEELRRYEEQLEAEKQKKLRDQKRREVRRDKRRRRKEKAKQREEENGKKGGRKRKGSGDDSTSSASSGSENSSSSEDEDLAFVAGSNKKFPEELKQAIKKQLKQKAEGTEIAEMGDRKRKYHRGLEDQQQQNPSELDKEAYNLTRIHSADPMAQFFEEKEQKKQMAKKAKTEK